jgi:FG-GAP-like repeat/Secretion system C-terminal sorting domain
MQRAMVIVVAFLLPVLAAAQEWTEHTVDNEFVGVYDVYAVDVDGDGDMDVLGAAESANAITWWENLDGTGLNWSEHTVDGEFSDALSVYAEDVDSDGDIDILGAARYDGISWWENLDGSGMNWTEHTVDGDYDWASCVYAEDVDGDGDMDVLGVAYYAHDITWWENLDGSGLNWSEHTVEGEYEWASCVYAEDVDGDGDMDVLGTAFVADDITWWENLDGTGLNWSEHTLDGDFDGAYSVYATDLDGDGDMDVLGVARDGDDIIWWENLDGTGLNWSEHTVESEFDGVRTAYAEDLDGDGDFDVLAAAYVADDITWWENLDGTGQTWSEHTLDGDFVGARSVYAEDFDGDGDMDVIGAARWEDTILWWENPLIVGVDEESASDLPDEYALRSVYPNPFNPTTTISVSLPSPSELDLAVFDVVGQQVATLADSYLKAGSHTFTFDASGLASGMYFVRATVPGRMHNIQKVILVR